MRTLVIANVLPYPPAGGAPLRAWQTINLMARRGPVALFSVLPSKSGGRLQEIPILERQVIFREEELRPIGTIQAVVDSLRSLLWIVQPSGHPTAERLFDPKAALALESLIQDFKPTHIIFEEPWTVRYLPHTRSCGAIRILNAHNVEGLTHRELSRAVPHPLLRFRDMLRATRVPQIEQAFLSEVDQVWVCSDEDLRTLTDLYSSVPPAHVIPNAIDASAFPSVGSDADSSPKADGLSLIFTGSFGYEPNAQAARFLIEEIMPPLKRGHPSVRLMLVGTNPSQRMIEAAKADSSIVVTGYVNDIRPYLANAAVAIVPLRSGGGTRLKILEAFAAGVPVVSTQKGAEGIRAKPNEHLLICDNTADIIDAIEYLQTHPDERKRISLAARRLVESEYSWDAVDQRVQDALDGPQPRE